MIKLLDNVISLEEQSKVLNLVLSNTFQWYYQSRMVDQGDNVPIENISDQFFFSHNLIARQGEDEFGNHLWGEIPMEGKVNSKHWDNLSFIFTRSVQYKKIFRAALNLTFGFSNKPYSVPHKDHSFDHKNFICYLNNFSDGYTYLIDDNTITNSIVPKERCAVVFDGKNLHAQGFCKPNEKRLVMVVTFN